MMDINKKPIGVNDSILVGKVLDVARSYLNHAGDLIYSYGSKTFLSGYDLYDTDYNGRGNIDCSTFILLVLAGIPYDRSPYETGSVKDIKAEPFLDMDFSCFSQIPERYITIAERIGRPEIAGPKGIDMEKAVALGISSEQLMAEIKASGVSRRSVDLAMYFLNKGACFLDEECLMPGDIVFYQSESFFKDAKHKPVSVMEVTHVGIVGENPMEMINSSGYFSKERAMDEGLAAVSVAPVNGKRKPVFYARPCYR